jgi:transcriptional regulator with XRE-family HTH domain
MEEMTSDGPAEDGTGTGSPQQPIGAVIRSARQRRYWTQRRLAHEMQLAARRMGRTVPKTESLVVSISRWECHERSPDFYSRLLLRSSLGLSNGDLRLPGN